jgi:hypothetical protein
MIKVIGKLDVAPAGVNEDGSRRKHKYFTQPTCTTCGRRKAPVGRSVADASHGSYCTYDECSGYALAPLANGLWSGEETEKDESMAHE